MSAVPRERIMASAAGEHPACRAWNRLAPHKAMPGAVQQIQLKTRSQVYRLLWARPKAPEAHSIIAKRCRTHMALVERAVYEVVLPSVPVAAPRLRGYLDDPDSDPDDPFAWLFIEDLGDRRFSPNDVRERSALAQWLGSVQATWLDAAPGVVDALPARDATYYRQFVERAIEELPALAVERSFSRPTVALLGAVQTALECMSERWDDVTAAFLGVPMTLVHGDCLPKNIHVAGASSDSPVIPIDWGNAGWGLPASDLGQSSLLLADNAMTEAAYDEYTRAIRHAWPACDTGLAERLANLGRLLWGVKVIAMSVPAFRYDTAARVEQALSMYASALFTSLHLAGWWRAGGGRPPGGEG